MISDYSAKKLIYLKLPVPKKWRYPLDKMRIAGNQAGIQLLGTSGMSGLEQVHDCIVLVFGG